MSKAAVGYRNGDISVMWHRSGVPSTDGLTDAEVVDAATPDDALAAYDAIRLTNHAAVKAKNADVKAWYTAAIAAGFDTGLGFRLRLDDAARNEFDTLMTSINTQLILGVPIASIAMPLISGLDESAPYGIDDGHPLTAAEFINVFSAGKIYYSNLLALRTSYLAEIKAGRTNFTLGEPIGGA